MQGRLYHLWRITRLGWFVTYEVVWALLANLDILIVKYGSEHTKLIWERFIHPHWGWRTWVIGALVILFVFVWEGSYKKHSELAQELKELKESGPEVLIDFKFIPDHPTFHDKQRIRVHNLHGGTARNIVLEVEDKWRKPVFDSLPYLATNSHTYIDQRYIVNSAENADGGHTVVDLSQDFMAYLRMLGSDEDENSPFAIRRMTLSYSNERLVRFEQDFRLYYNTNSEEVYINPVDVKRIVPTLKGSK